MSAKICIMSGKNMISITLGSVLFSHRVASYSVASHGSRSIAPHALAHRVEHASSSMRVGSPHRMPDGRTHSEGSFRCTLLRLSLSLSLSLLRKLALGACAASWSCRVSHPLGCSIGALVPAAPLVPELSVDLRAHPIKIDVW